MKTSHIVIIVVIIIIGLAALLIYKWNDWFGAPVQTDYDVSCIATNKAKGDGEDCTNCTSQNSRIRIFHGVIKNGECIQKSEKKYIISTPDGAVSYVLQNNNFVAPSNAQKIPYNTEVKIISVSTDRNYVETSYGWINVNDIGVA